MAQALKALALCSYQICMTDTSDDVRVTIVMTRPLLSKKKSRRYYLLLSSKLYYLFLIGVINTFLTNWYRRNRILLISDLE